MQQAQVQARTAPVYPALGRWLAARARDWEDWLTFLLAIGLVYGVTRSIEDAGITEQMPGLSLVGAIALLMALLLARSPLPAWLAWPLGAVMGAAVAFWQTLERISGGNLEEKVDTIHIRFQTWFRIALDGGVSNDPLPFVVLLVGLTWGGIFLSAWSLFRWHYAWPGIIAGGVAIFINLTATGTDLPATAFLFSLSALLLLMRASVTGRMHLWQREGIAYPSFLSLSYLHLSLWALVLILGFAWILPAGGRPATGFWDSLAERSSGVAVGFVRLAGPLHANKITPIHDYTAVLPFDGSVKLRERRLLSVTIDDPSFSGPLLLRGAAYDEYSAGGWQAGDRIEIDVPEQVGESLREKVESGEVKGKLLPLTIQVDAKSVVGTILFSPGQPLDASVSASLRLPKGSITTLPVQGAAGLSDEEVLRDLVPEGYIGLSVGHGNSPSARVIRVIDEKDLLLPDTVVFRPQRRLQPGDSYQVVGFLPAPTAEDLRSAAVEYPAWVAEHYLQLPQSLPERVNELAEVIAADAEGTGTAYDIVRAVEIYLRTIPLDYKVGETPPGADTVDYFLFEARRGYFDYHASAMVVMLRALGIPSRMAVGFLLDPDSLDPETGAYTIRDKNAYAWPEVYFPGYGWIEFNPTPDQPSFPLLGDLLAGGEFGGADGFFGDAGDLFGGGLPETGVSGVVTGVSPGRPAIPMSVVTLLVVLVLIAGAAGGAFYLWRRLTFRLALPFTVWEETLRLADWAGYRADYGQTPSEHATFLGRTLGCALDMDYLARMYNRCRFGRYKPNSEEALRLTDIRKYVRGILIWEIILNRIGLRRRTID